MCAIIRHTAAATRARTLVTEFILPYALGTPSSKAEIKLVIIIKPERHLELVVERQPMDRWGLTIAVQHSTLELQSHGAWYGARFVAIKTPNQRVIVKITPAVSIPCL